MNIVEKLFEVKDDKYADFQVKLTPGIKRENCIGVRVPIVRKIAKEYIKAKECTSFLQELPHKYYDENMLHGLILSEMNDYDDCIRKVNDFLPYVDNWAVCDIMSPKVFKKHKTKLIENIKKWIKSEHEYTVRFGIEMLLSHYLDEDFKTEYLELIAEIDLDYYYVKMMVAWYFATALTKQWDSTIPFMENRKLGAWTHNKTIQKARESYRITAEKKKYLKSLKILNKGE